MTIGERIKKIRVFRKMTMDELGGALGFEGKNMSVRISQYETGGNLVPFPRAGRDVALSSSQKSVSMISSAAPRL